VLLVEFRSRGAEFSVDLVRKATDGRGTFGEEEGGHPFVDRFQPELDVR
jgi:hypothetical protein